MSYTSDEIKITKCAVASAKHFNEVFNCHMYYLDTNVIRVMPVDYSFEYHISFIMRTIVDSNLATRPDDQDYMSNTFTVDIINIRANAMRMEEIPKLLEKALAKWLLKK